MALKLGVGDVFTVCKGAVDLCSRSIRDGHEPEEVQSIVAEMKLIRTHLKDLESQIGDEKAFCDRTARYVSQNHCLTPGRRDQLIKDRAPVIKRSLEPLHRDMLNMNQVLHECKRGPSVHIVDKVRCMILYKAKLEAFRQKLPAHRESICVVQELIDAQSQSERRDSTMKLCELVENQEKQQMKDEEYDRAQKEVMKMFERRHSSVERDRQLSTAQMLECLEDDLVAKGFLGNKLESNFFHSPERSICIRSQLSSVNLPKYKGQCSNWMFSNANPDRVLARRKMDLRIFLS